MPDECCPTAESGQRSMGSLQIFANWFHSVRPFKRWPDVIFNSFRLSFPIFLLVFLRMNAPSGKKGYFLYIRQ